MRSTNRFVLMVIVAGSLFPTAKLKADLIAHYRFDESSGTNAATAVGSVNGTLQGSASFVSGGISGNAVSLVSSGDGVVNMGNNFGFLAGDYSISFWVNTTTTEADSLALSKHSAGFTNGYLFAIGPTGGGGAAGKANFTASTFVANGVTSTTTVNDGTWHHIVGVYQAGGNHLIYVDGAPAEQSKPSASMIGSVSDFLVGGVGQIGNPLMADGRYTGLFDDLQIYDNPLSDSEINILFNNPGVAIPEPTALMFVVMAGSLVLPRRRR